MHICIGKLTIIGSDNGLSPGRRQAIIWNNAGILLIAPLGTNFSENLIRILTYSFTKMHLKMLSVKWHPFCLGLNVLRFWVEHVTITYLAHEPAFQSKVWNMIWSSQLLEVELELSKYAQLFIFPCEPLILSNVWIFYVDDIWHETHGSKFRKSLGIGLTCCCANILEIIGKLSVKSVCIMNIFVYLVYFLCTLPSKYSPEFERLT